MDKQELIKKIESEIKDLDARIYKDTAHGERINTYIVARSNYYIALSTLVASPEQVVVNTYYDDTYDYNDD